MTVKKMRWLTLIVLAGMFALAAYGLVVIPLDVNIPMQTGLDGELQNYMPAPVALLLLPVIGLVVSLLFYGLPWIEPRRENLKKSGPLYLTSWAVVLGLLLVVQVQAVLRGMGHEFDSHGWMLGVVAVGLMLIGNVLGKSRSTFFLGIRTPWTLSDEQVWKKTNRLAGWLLVLTGGISLALLILMTWQTGALALAIGAGLSALGAVLYSFVLWIRRDRTGGQE